MTKKGSISKSTRCFFATNNPESSFELLKKGTEKKDSIYMRIKHQRTNNIMYCKTALSSLSFTLRVAAIRENMHFFYPLSIIFFLQHVIWPYFWVKQNNMHPCYALKKS